MAMLVSSERPYSREQRVQLINELLTLRYVYVVDLCGVINFRVPGCQVVH